MTLKPLTRALGPLGVTSSVAPFDPSTLTNLLAWYKADSLALSDGAAVASWPDSSSHATPATQTTPGNQPTYKASIVNGKPVVRFSGAAVNMLLGAGLAAAFADNAMTLFCVHVPRTAGQYGIALGRGLGNKDDNFLLANFQTTNSITCFLNLSGVVGAPYSFVDGTPLVSEILSSGSVLTPIKNGTLQGTGVPPTTSDSLLAIGNYAPGGFPYAGDFAEILLYNRALTSSERHQVEGYLGTKYNITMAVQ